MNFPRLKTTSSYPENVLKELRQLRDYSFLTLLIRMLHNGYGQSINITPSIYIKASLYVMASIYVILTSIYVIFDIRSNLTGTNLDVYRGLPVLRYWNKKINFLTEYCCRISKKYRWTSLSVVFLSANSVYGLGAVYFHSVNLVWLRVF